MDEYIEREALEVALNHRLNFLMAVNGEYDHYTSGFDEAVTIVENFPAADVAPVRYGHWCKPYKSGLKVSAGVVSSCCDMWNDRRSNYCPNCGAKMGAKYEQQY